MYGAAPAGGPDHVDYGAYTGGEFFMTKSYLKYRNFYKYEKLFCRFTLNINMHSNLGEKSDNVAELAKYCSFQNKGHCKKRLAVFPLIANRLQWTVTRTFVNFFMNHLWGCEILSKVKSDLK